MNRLPRRGSSRLARGATRSLARSVTRRFASAATIQATPTHATLSLDDVRTKAANGEIDTVIMGFTDIYGRLMGKRFHVDFFLEEAAKNGSHCCDYLLTCDMENEVREGFKSSNWEDGYGDFHITPDMNTLVQLSWANKTALVLCDVENEKTHTLNQYAPRSVLKRAIENAATSGYSCKAASELEYYIYKETPPEAQAKGYENLTPIGYYMEDYHILQASRSEFFNAEARRHLALTGIPVETSKGEAGIGQHELNVKYADILSMADRHVVFKQCLKEVAEQVGCSITFMAKPYHTATGSGCHIHLSLWRQDGSNAFVGDQNVGSVEGISDEFRWFLAGWMHYTPECFPFYAPTVNSYKRFITKSWAPTRLAFADDNRTGGFRIVGSGQSKRIEMRIPGADMNPYLGFAAALASGFEGVKQQMEPPPIFKGNIYEAASLPTVPKSLHIAVDKFANSEFANRVFGEDVVEHYAHFYTSEWNEYCNAVTDWERHRYWERI